ncbi:MAG: hypothetical protein HQM15_03190 [Deltaproteobacteria bacterium]|nr:hypothetical protein [Deltaproteobacteria bacterium]
MIYSLSTLQHDLQNRLKELSDLELRLDEIRSFKRDYFSQIQKEDTENHSPLPEVFQNLSSVAQCVLQATYQIAFDSLTPTYGFPSFIDNSGNLMRAEFAIVAMGKFGGREMHYYSDLDLIFLYNRNGDTEGRKKISNKEFYALLAQKLISYLTVHTLRGYAFKVDTQLRPSGNQGPLISSLDAFADYQRNFAQIWEKQALLKARFVCGDEGFGKTLKEHTLRFIFSTEFPNNLNEEIHRMRLRMEKELAKESARRLHYKQGPGGIVDIEFAVQYLQLKMGKIFESIVCENTLEAIEKMGEREVLRPPEYEILKDAYLFYRLLETRLEVFFDLRQGYLDPQTPLLENIAEVMGYQNGKLLMNEFTGYRKKVRQTYLRILQVENL